MGLSRFGVLVDLGLACGEVIWGHSVCVWCCRSVCLGCRWRLAILTGGYMARVNETGRQSSGVKFDPCNQLPVMWGSHVVVLIVICFDRDLFGKLEKAFLGMLLVEGGKRFGLGRI